nr:phosphoglycerate dehydrogenase [Wohlfahrtiimonas chitiniclastica]
MDQMYSLAKEKIKIVLFEGIHPSAVECLHKSGYTNVVTYAKALEGAELIEALKDAHIIGIRSRTRITKEVLDQAPKLMAIGCFCIGTNQVDLEETLARAIPVFNAPYSNTRSVAELVIAEMIMLMRGIPEKNYVCHEGGWLKSANGSHEVRGKTLGIIGYGHIGTQVSILAESFGMNVVYYDTETKLALGNSEPLDLKRLLEVSDIVTLHVPEDASTKNLMSRENLNRMKKGAVLLNASRGTVVDLQALADLIESKHLAGAAIDVFPVEPKSNQDEFITPLRNFRNVILTPHIGGSTMEAQENIAVEVAVKLVKYSDNGSTITAVNFPEVSLPVNPDSHRILHIHHNVPGILRTMNNLVSNYDMNIDAQYLQTSGDIGYVVLDVKSTEQDAEALYKEMQHVDGTIRCRLLF